MLINREVARFAVASEDSILTGLQRISENKSGVTFCVSLDGVLEGVLTDGDFRRWVVGAEALDLELPLSCVMNREFVWASEQSSPEELEALLSPRVGLIPLVDDRRRLVGVASRGSERVTLGPFTIDSESPTVTVAEIGINHNGRLDTAFELIDRAREAGADCAKFQMRHMAAVYRHGGNRSGHEEDLGAQYTLDLLSRFRLTPAELFKAFDRCTDVGLLPLCTPWDDQSVRALEDYGVSAYKVASADLTNHDLLTTLAATGRPLLVSTGMSTEAEIRESAALLRREGAAYVLLHCNSTYPAPYKDVNLSYLERLREIGGGRPVGYSGHERGYYVAIAAVAHGAKVVEKHFTLDRDMEGTDHKVSLLPNEFQQMVHGIRQVEMATGSAVERRVTQGELINRVTLAKSLVAAREIRSGEMITEDAVEVKSPGRGLQPNQRRSLIGQTAKRSLKTGDFFYASDLTDRSATPRTYQFRRPWGLPVRHHDYRILVEQSNPDLLEFHLSYRDLELTLEDFFEEALPLDLVVHSPDLFAGDHILDLASDDPTYRERSIFELQRVVELTRSLSRFFERAAEPFIVVSMGGFTRDTPLPAAGRPERYARVAGSLSQIDSSGVRLIAQTLPPFPWYMGGQLYCNLFVDADDTADFCETYGYDLCLDVAHTKLATNHHHGSLKDSVESLGPFVRHLHLVDARGVDDEGLQIGEGQIDFAALAEQLERLAPQAGFIPEIWQGHNDNGEEFWTALERLEKWF